MELDKKGIKEFFIKALEGIGLGLIVSGITISIINKVKLGIIPLILGFGFYSLPILWKKHSQIFYLVLIFILILLLVSFNFIMYH